MRSILRLWAWVHPVLIGRRDEEHGPLVQLRLLPSPSGSLPRCDHGNIYCSRRCGGTARRHSQRLSGQRYQHSHRGRHKHAERQRRYRERRRRRVLVATVISHL